MKCKDTQKDEHSNYVQAKNGGFVLSLSAVIDLISTDFPNNREMKRKVCEALHLSHRSLTWWKFTGSTISTSIYEADTQRKIRDPVIIDIKGGAQGRTRKVPTTLNILSAPFDVGEKIGEVTINAVTSIFKKRK